MRRASRWVAAVLGPVLLSFGALTPAQAATPGPVSAPEYWFDTWQIPQLWAEGADGHGITIAVLDTGVDAKLPELAGRVLSGTDLGVGGNGQIDRDDSQSAFGHGTAMASIMVAQATKRSPVVGIAPGAKILPIALPLENTTDASSDTHVDEAIRYAADHGAKIISMSIGQQRTPNTDPVACPTDEQNAVYYALNKGAVLFASSGNTGQSGNLVEDPGVCVGVVSVGAVTNTDAVAGFSSRHPYLTLSAPGLNVPSVSPSGAVYQGSGTSQATAITSAVAALVWSKYPQLTGNQLVTRLMATLDKRTGSHDDGLGYGIVNAHTAVTGNVPAGLTNPVFSAAAPFLAQAEALSRPNPAPNVSPPSSNPARFGTEAIPRATPHSQRARVLWSLISAVGLLALILLIVIGVRARRRRATEADALVGAGVAPDPRAGVGAPLASPPGPSAPAVARQLSSEDRAALEAEGTAGLMWHDITGPPPEPPTAEVSPSDPE